MPGKRFSLQTEQQTINGKQNDKHIVFVISMPKWYWNQIHIIYGPVIKSHRTYVVKSHSYEESMRSQQMWQRVQFWREPTASQQRITGHYRTATRWRANYSGPRICSMCLYYHTLCVLAGNSLVMLHKCAGLSEPLLAVL